MKKRTALVTGASRGIGLAVAKRLEKSGFCVLAPTRKEMDLFSDSSMDRYLSGLKKPVDVIVNNAGINLLASVTEAGDDNIQETVQVNLTAPMRIIRKIVPQMIARKYGRIVNISSILGIVAKPGRAAYSMSKAGLIGLTRALAVELACHNILVNAVAPGYVDTELTRKNNSKKELDAIRQNIPLRRLARPSEIAEAVLVLISEKNTYITGQTIVIDGGFTCL